MAIPVPDNVQYIFTRTSIPENYGIKCTYCVVHIVGDETGYRFFESGGDHAEKKLIDHFEDLKKPIKLFVYLSRAPCGDCAGQIQEFCEDKNVEMEIYAVGPHFNNETALRALIDSGRGTLAPFNEAVFGRLAQLLGQRAWDYTTDMRERDEETSRRFQGIKDKDLSMKAAGSSLH